MSIQSVIKYAEELKEYSKKLTDSDALRLAIEIERNEILRAGLNVSTDNSYPSALEALAMALGFQLPAHGLPGNGGMVGALEEIANSIDNISRGEGKTGES
jgi:hypothetical protein